MATALRCRALPEGNRHVVTQRTADRAVLERVFFDALFVEFHPYIGTNMVDTGVFNVFPESPHGQVAFPGKDNRIARDHAALNVSTLSIFIFVYCASVMCGDCLGDL